MHSKTHWDNVYKTRKTDEVSWFQEHADLSLKLIRENAVSLSASIVDIGGGASTLVDDLLKNGYQRISVLDLSGIALEKARLRLKDFADQVKWIVADITRIEFAEGEFDVWHDRAVFHFLVKADDRRRYIATAHKALKAGSMLIIATFAENGPAMCSGLPVMQYSATTLAKEFGDNFGLISSFRESHHTPGGKEQRFTYCVFRRL
jgi:SAM-dependent methyltransferase